MMLYTTLNSIKKCNPCGTGKNDDFGFRKLLNYLGKEKTDNEHVSFKTILESNGLDDALWCLRSISGYDKELRLYAVWCARQVEHLDESGISKKTNDISEKFAYGEATQEQLDAAWYAAMDAAWSAARAAAWAAARDAAWAAAMDAAWAAHEQEFIKLFCTEE